LIIGGNIKMTVKKGDNKNQRFLSLLLLEDNKK